jgi:hypothetical protein
MNVYRARSHRSHTNGVARERFGIDGDRRMLRRPAGSVETGFDEHVD